jgi:hypothetical protein
MILQPTATRWRSGPPGLGPPAVLWLLHDPTPLPPPPQSYSSV